MSVEDNAMARMYEFRVDGKRIQRSFGTDDAHVMKAIRVMIAELKRNPKGNLLEGIISKKLSLLQAYKKWSSGDGGPLTVESALPFHETVLAWIDDYDDIKPKTKEDYRSNVAQLVKVKASFTLDEVPQVLKLYRKQCQKAAKPRAFNTCRNTLRSFLSGYFGPFHPLYLAVVQVKPLPEAPKQARALSVTEVKALMLKLRPEVAAQFWTMCTTGAGITEYEAGLSVEGNGIRIKGEKMLRIDDRRNRLVPLVDHPAPMAVKEQQFGRLIRSASNNTVRISDARKTFARWCLEAGIDEPRQLQYMGHLMVTTTMGYQMAKLQQYLKDDAQLLRDYIANDGKFANADGLTVNVEGIGKLRFIETHS